MCYWSRTPLESFRTTPCSPFLCPISHTIPTFFQHPSHLTFHHRVLPHFQLIPTKNLQVTCPQPCHLNPLKKYNLRSLYHIHRLLPVNIKFPSFQYLHSHTQGFHLSHPEKSHLIKTALILRHPQVCF